MMASLDSGLSAASSTKVVTNHIQPSVIDVVGDHFWSLLAGSTFRLRAVLIDHACLASNLPFGSEGGGERIELAAVRFADGGPDHRAEQPHRTGHGAAGH